MPKKLTAESVRPPVIAILGHVDHGKSTLLDYIRKTNVASGEAGGITQHMGAYEVEVEHAGKKRKITFLDTPGHEAFAGIRSRGASVADIAVLVVSAEDGVKPQTLEALRFIKKSETPFLVALTKTDKPDSNTERAKQSLAENEIYVEGYGGDVPCVPVSGKTGAGIPEFLETSLLVAELEELKGNHEKSAEGFVIEAHLDSKKGIAATLLIKDGTLRNGMAVVAGDACAPVRIMENYLGKKIAEATFSSPVRIIGWSKIPAVGSAFTSCATKREAEQCCENMPAHASTKNTAQKSEEDMRVIIPLVIKADVSGSLEAIEHELKKLPDEKVILKIIHRGIGPIGEADLKVASGVAGAIVLGFNSAPDSASLRIADQMKIEVKTFDIIYRLIEFIKEVTLARTPKVMTEESKGVLKVMKTFSRLRSSEVIGGKVESGSLSVGDEFKILRREAEIGRGKIKELQQMKEKVREVVAGYECGLSVESKMEIAPGDRIEVFTIVAK